MSFPSTLFPISNHKIEGTDLDSFRSPLPPPVWLPEFHVSVSWAQDKGIN